MYNAPSWVIRYAPGVANKVLYLVPTFSGFIAAVRFSLVLDASNAYFGMCILYCRCLSFQTHHEKGTPLKLGGRPTASLYPPEYNLHSLYSSPPLASPSCLPTLTA